MEDDDRGGDRPCFADALVAGHVVDPATWRDVARFRKAERERLYALRRGMAQDRRAAQTGRVIAALRDLLPEVPGATVAGYWPIRGELDLRPWLAELAERGAQVALPVVVGRGRPVAFHRWRPGAAMTRGAWNIPVPAEPVPVEPDIVVVPLVGVDAGCFRLGNGGGYYDMTLAAMARPVRTIAVGQDFCRIPTIFPQPWDIAMQSAVLGDGSVIRAPVAQTR